jgi:prepilin-type N-terminal cleavage/methylation domain-containing protein
MHKQVRRTNRSVPRFTRRRGLGMVELMICLSISSLLLTFVAMTFQSSFNSYRDSQERGQMLNAARGAMKQIIEDIRMADAGGPYDPNASTMSNENTQFNSQTMPGSPTPGVGGSGTIGIQLAKTHADAIDPTASAAHPVLITYWYASGTQQIMMTRQSSAATITAPVCNFVQSFQVFIQPVYVPANAALGISAGVVMQRAVVTMSLANMDANGKQIITGGQKLTLTFSDAATSRKNFGGV